MVRRNTHLDLVRSYAPLRNGIRSMLIPAERFLTIEAASGIVLMVAAFAALAWANSPWRTVYADLWRIPIGFNFGPLSFERHLDFWISDGLMTVFCFVVGLEIRREIYSGELSDRHRAGLPLVAAVGGMLLPALIFLTLNFDRVSQVGWAIPVATDIAFAVGLGTRVPPAMRIVLALALIDDIGAILVIVSFYSASLTAIGFAIVALGISAVFVMRGMGIALCLAYIAPGIVIWVGTYCAGIHPSLSGVIVGLLTPVKPLGVVEFPDNSKERVTLAHSKLETASPAERLQNTLHGWVAFGIMPLFALANAGVPISDVDFAGDAK
jgi:NhaA family Na+:H+ antiporter